MSEAYAQAGVDTAAGDTAVRRIKDKVRSTYRPEVLGDVGGFGGLFALPTDRFEQPVLVAATDGVGTKVAVAEQLGKLDTIGIDLVAMCVDDLVCQGAEPLFFLDYISTGKLDPDRMEQVVAGVAEGCRTAGCALIGGEMAEHPGVMGADQLDLVGFAVGVVERDRILTGAQARAGDVLVALPSPGLRSNGYSLARKVLFDTAGLSLDDDLFPGRTVGDELLLPSVIYAPAVVALLREVEVRGISHITGGGIVGNLPRMLPNGVDAVVDRATWEVPQVFLEIQRRGEIDDDEMAQVFNLGLGMVIAVASDDLDQTLTLLQQAEHRAVPVGEVVSGEDNSQGGEVWFR